VRQGNGPYATEMDHSLVRANLSSTGSLVQSLGHGVGSAAFRVSDGVPPPCDRMALPIGVETASRALRPGNARASPRCQLLKPLVSLETPIGSRVKGRYKSARRRLTILSTTIEVPLGLPQNLNPYSRFLSLFVSCVHFWVSSGVASWVAGKPSAVDLVWLRVLLLRASPIP
jgi:hypothetical protein